MSGFGGLASSEVELARTAVAVTNTLDANENALATVTIPPLLANSQIIVDWLGSKTGSQIVTFRVRLGGAAGTQHWNLAQTTGLSVNDSLVISNRGATNSQVGPSVSVPFGQSTPTVTTGAIDTSVATTLLITAQQSAASVSASEVVKLERYRVRIIY